MKKVAIVTKIKGGGLLPVLLYDDITCKGTILPHLTKIKFGIISIWWWRHRKEDSYIFQDSICDYFPLIITSREKGQYTILQKSNSGLFPFSDDVIGKATILYRKWKWWLFPFGYVAMGKGTILQHLKKFNLRFFYVDDDITGKGIILLHLSKNYSGLSPSGANVMGKATIF